MVAGLISLLLIAVSIFWVGGGSLITARNRTLAYFYEETDAGPSLDELITGITGQVSNMTVVLGRTDGTQELIQDLLAQVSQVNDAQNRTDMLMYEGLVQNLVASANAIEADEDADQLSYILATINSNYNMLSTRSYNTQVEVFNERLSVFPANVIAQVRGIARIPAVFVR